jgi:hypothetical protein
MDSLRLNHCNRALLNSKLYSLAEIQQNHYLRPTGKVCERNGRHLFETTILEFV